MKTEFVWKFLKDARRHALSSGLSRALIAPIFLAPIVLALGLLVPAGGASAQVVVPDIHLGVTSCAGSTCHGSVEPWTESTVLQNEYVTWQRQDKHSKAYEVLLNDVSKRIGKNLGIEVTKSKECLVCHTDYVPQAMRGKTFQLSDGVGCEACHGGGAPWIGVHLSGAGHQVNLKAGLYPTEEPVARAKLCLSCHLGDGERFVSHRIMGAGHPRISFELDTFTALQPAHYKVDSDYVKRKQVASGIQVWAIGQAMAVQNTLKLMLDPKHGSDGIFPELVFFDCHACHHPMSNTRWQARASTGLPPGVVRLNDSNMIMLKIVTGHVDKALGDKLAAETKALHQASTQSWDATKAAAKALQATTAGLVNTFKKHSFKADDIKAIAQALVAEGMAGEFADYAGAEQATLALGTMIEVMAQAGIASGDTLAKMNSAIEACYKAVEKDEAYRPETFMKALADFAATLPKG